MGLFGHGESLETLPMTLQDLLVESLVERVGGSWVKRVEGRKYTLARYRDEQGTDNRELTVTISPFKEFGGRYFQAVRLISDPETHGVACFLERRVDLYDGQYYELYTNMNYSTGEVGGNPELAYLCDEVLDPFLGFMQIPTGFASRLLPA